MHYRPMGKLGWDVSALGFGTMRFPLRGSWTEINEEQSAAMLCYAIDHGVNYIDTAWRYHDGVSEEFLGRTLTREQRAKVRLVTKSPIWLIESKTDFHHFFAKQANRLKTDTIDIYLFHAVNGERWEKIKRLKLLDEMEKLRREGRIKHIGFSFHGSPNTFNEMLDAYPWDMAQIQYNYLDTEFQATVRGLDYAHSKGVAVVVMEPLRGGKLAQHNPEIDLILQEAPIHKALVEWGLHFVMNHPGVATVLSGMSTLEQVEENIAYANSFPSGGLSTPELELIERLRHSYEKKIRVPCTSCRYCVPCPEGVEIPENLSLLNQAVWEGKTLGWMHKWYQEFESTDPYTYWHGKGAASRCTSCGECLSKCPQNIAIPDELVWVRRLFEEGLSVDQLKK